MGMRTSHEGGVQHAGQRNVGTKLSAAFEKALVLQSRQPCADAKLAHHRPLSWGTTIDWQCQSGFCIQFKIALPVSAVSTRETDWVG